MHLAVGFPCYRAQLHAAHVFQASNLALHWWKQQHEPLLMLYVDSCFVDKARNILIQQALEKGADWLLMCDSDTYYTAPGPIIKMLADAVSRSAAVIGAAVRLRKREGEIYNAALAPDFAPMTREQIGEHLRPVDRIGGAFTAINLGWLRDNWHDSPWFMVQHIAGPKPDTVGEDCWFSDGVKKRGGTILVDPRFEPSHVGATPDEVSALCRVGVEAQHV